MITLHYVLIVLLLVLFLVAYYCVKFALIVLKIQDALTESLDILDQKYHNLSKILEIPIFYDSSEVRNAINEVEDAKNVMLYIANRLTESVEQKAILEDDEKTREDEEEA